MKLKLKITTDYDFWGLILSCPYLMDFGIYEKEDNIRQIKVYQYPHFFGEEPKERKILGSIVLKNDKVKYFVR